MDRLHGLAAKAAAFQSRAANRSVWLVNKRIGLLPSVSRFGAGG